MRFQITLNMPSRTGNYVHQVIGEHDCKSLESFCELLNDSNFIIVTEFYKKDGPDHEPLFYSNGEILINTDWIGKVKVFNS